jgi:ketosteroid isomerase-like protein
MSEENVETMRRAAAAMISGDAATALSLLDPEIEWHATVGGIDEGRVYRGPEEVAKAFADYFETWERIELRVDELLDTDGEDVVTLWHERARGRKSGAVVETDTGTVNTIRNGKIVRVRSYMDRSEALRAGGLLD